MAWNLIEDIKTVSELKNDLRGVFRHVHETGRPVVITVNGKPDMVLVDAATYEHDVRALTLGALLARGEEDIRRGRTRPFRAVFKELRRARKISR